MCIRDRLGPVSIKSVPFFWFVWSLFNRGPLFQVLPLLGLLGCSELIPVSYTHLIHIHITYSFYMCLFLESIFLFVIPSSWRQSRMVLSTVSRPSFIINRLTCLSLSWKSKELCRIQRCNNCFPYMHFTPSASTHFELSSLLTQFWSIDDKDCSRTQQLLLISNNVKPYFQTLTCIEFILFFCHVRCLEEL